MTDFINPPEPSEELALSWLKEIGLKRPKDSEDHWSLDFSRKAIAWATPIVAAKAQQGLAQQIIDLNQRLSKVQESLTLLDLQSLRHELLMLHSDLYNRGIKTDETPTP